MEEKKKIRAIGDLPNVTKSLEAVRVHWDNTVRNASAEVVDWVYGVDGLDGSQLEKLELKFLAQASRHFGFTDQEKTRYEALWKEAVQAKISILNPKLSCVACLPFNIENVLLQERDNRRTNNKDKKHKTLEPEEAFVMLGEFLEELSQTAYTLYLRVALCYHLRFAVVGRRESREQFADLLGRLRDLYRRAKVQPGEMTGVLAAASISEPSTQLTLNTHRHPGSSSAHVVTGIVRLRELIGASAKLKTPWCTMALKQNTQNRDTLTQLAATLVDTTLKDVLVRPGCVLFAPDPLCDAGMCDASLCDATHFLAKEQGETDRMLLESYRFAVTTGVLQKPSQTSRFVLRFVLDREKLRLLRLTPRAVVDKLYAHFPNRAMYHVLVAEPHMPELVLRVRILQTSADEEEEKQLAQRLLMHLSTGLLLTGVRGVRQTQVAKIERSCIEEAQEPQESREPQGRQNLQGPQSLQRPQSLQGPQNLQGPTVRTHETFQIQVAGNHLRALWDLDICEWSQTWTNNVQETAQMLGIEAGAQQLFFEIQKVLEAEYVDPRHALLLVNAMTRTGTIVPLNRHGLTKLNVGVLAKCSFEETVPVLFDAAQFAKENVMSGVSDNIFFGQPINGGTGCVGLIEPPQNARPHIVTRISVYAEEEEQEEDKEDKRGEKADNKDNKTRVRNVTPPRIEVRESPTSPVYWPTSPVYFAASPKSTKSPKSPFYVPSSPEYCSPKYAKKSTKATKSAKTTKTGKTRKSTAKKLPKSPKSPRIPEGRKSPTRKSPEYSHSACQSSSYEIEIPRPGKRRFEPSTPESLDLQNTSNARQRRAWYPSSPSQF